MKTLKLSLIFLSFLLLGCGGGENTTTQAEEAVEETQPETSDTTQDFDQQITEKYWKLITLEGQAETMAENQERERFFILKTQENRVTGFAGCNTLTGTYALEEGNRIRFSNMGTTLMACPDVDVNEAAFTEVFNLADNYTIHNDTLSLNVGRRAPLAVFAAVYFN